MLVHFWADDLATHLRTALVGKTSADHCEYSTKLPDSAAPDDALNDRVMRALVLRLSLQHKAGSHITAPWGAVLDGLGAGTGRVISNELVRHSGVLLNES